MLRRFAREVRPRFEGRVASVKKFCLSRIGFRRGSTVFEEGCFHLPRYRTSFKRNITERDTPKSLFQGRPAFVAARAFAGKIHPTRVRPRSDRDARAIRKSQRLNEKTQLR
jgi:hypothetical protein